MTLLTKMTMVINVLCGPLDTSDWAEYGEMTWTIWDGWLAVEPCFAVVVMGWVPCVVSVEPLVSDIDSEGDTVVVAVSVISEANGMRFVGRLRTLMFRPFMTVVSLILLFRMMMIR